MAELLNRPESHDERIRDEHPPVGNGKLPGGRNFAEAGTVASTKCAGAGVPFEAFPERKRRGRPNPTRCLPFWPATGGQARGIDEHHKRTRARTPA